MKRSRLTALVAATAALTMFGLTAPATAEPTPPAPVESSAPEPRTRAPQTTPATSTPVETPAPSAEQTTPAPSPTTTRPQPDVSAQQTTPASSTPIADYAAANPWLGAPTGAETAVPGGLMRAYARGTVYWSEATGAQAVRGGMLARFNSVANPLETYGFPRTGELDGGNGRVYQLFTNDTLYWTPQHGAFPIIKGKYLTTWETQGQSGRFGFPITDLVVINGYQTQEFEFGGVTVKPDGSVLVVADGVGIGWRNLGGVKGFYGYPTSAEIPARDGGVYQTFQRGTVYWSAASGAFGVHGGIAEGYGNLGGLNGFYGYPTSGEIPGPNGGVYQNFQRGTIYWTARLGSHGVHGGIGQKWAATGGASGFFGYPVSFEIPSRDGAVYQVFERGTIYWSPAGGAQTVHGGIGAYWQASGAESSRFGFPTSGEYCNNAGCYQNFQYGSITWGPTTGAHDLYKLDARCTYGRVVCADKTTNKMYWVINGVIQGTFDARFGAPGWETANGEMTIFRKEAMSWSVPFSAWMPWSQYFHASGMAIHYSSGFEAEGFPSWGSHGCINMNNYSQAEWLFNQTRYGDRIVVYYS